MCAPVSTKSNTVAKAALPDEKLYPTSPDNRSDIALPNLSSESSIYFVSILKTKYSN
jgi:hypothetical protein